MISVMGTPGMSSRCKYHYLVDGPWTIGTNLWKIYDYLLKIIDIQIGILHALVRTSSLCKVQDTVSLKLHQVVKFLMQSCTMKRKTPIISVMGCPLNLNS